VYPVIRGIPRFVPSENYASSFGYQWNRFRREQIDACNGTQQSERRFRAETAWDRDSLKGKWILDAGCGAGRFLDVASRTEDCDVVGVDISTAVDAARDTLADRRNVHLVQASILELPFGEGSFDGVYCIGVIQHMPDPPRAIRSVAGMTRPGGRLALTVYERRRFTMLYSKYWLRPFTRRIRQEQLLAIIKAAMPAAFAVTEVLFRLPLLGRLFQFFIPIANYVDATDLSVRQRYQWALLDTFDMFAPTFDTPQREADVLELLRDAGVGAIQRLSNPGLNLVGTRVPTEPARI
jgi:2-polyprenyl-3-methyl-5-hydroxy-6-metoxy-1,4-benzoquinol methylase